MSWSPSIGPSMARARNIPETPEQLVQKVREDGRILWVPIRHFSPVCAAHVRRLVQEAAPVAVLVEGPEDATPLLPYLVDEGTVPPVTVMSTWVDARNRFGGNGVLTPDESVPARYRGWWPMVAWAPEYQALKERLGAMLLKTAEHVIPNLGKHLTFFDVGTPLTNVHYCAGHQGAVYGTEKTAQNLGLKAYPVRTELPGLSMVGASTISHGVFGATFSGLHAARAILGCPMDQLLQAGGPEIPLYPSERPDEWLDALKNRRNQRASSEAA